MLRFTAAERAKIAGKKQTAFLRNWPGSEEPKLQLGSEHVMMVGKAPFGKAKVKRARKTELGGLDAEMARKLGFANVDQATNEWKRIREGSASTKPGSVLWFVEFEVLELN